MGRVSVTAIVLCGGSSVRFGADKTRQVLGEGTVLDHLLASLPSSWAVVAVGVERAVVRDVTWTREQPPGGGPLAGIAAGLVRVRTPEVLVLAGDLPFAGPCAQRLLATLATDDGVDAVVARDDDGRINPLLAAYRAGVLRTALPPDPAGAPARLVLRSISHQAVPTLGDEALDVDTPQALEVARHRLDP